MVYPVSAFYRLVMSGDLYSEKWATSLSLFGSSNEPVDQDLLDAVTAVCVNYISGAGGISSQFYAATRLTEVKLNRIGPDGKYVDAVSWTKFGNPLAVGISATNVAPQLTPVVTLKTAFERGRASRGRMYLPPHAGYATPGTDGRATAAQAQVVATATTQFFNALRDAFNAWDGVSSTAAHPVVMSNVGLGAWHTVTAVECGRVIDTMRSRRSSLAEDYQASTVAPNWP